MDKAPTMATRCLVAALGALICTSAFARPVAFWPLDEGRGEVVRDRSESGNDGTLHNATWVEDADGLGLRLGGTGTDSYVEIPDDEVLSPARAFTMQFRWRKVSPAVQIFCRKGAPGDHFTYYAYAEGDLHFCVTATDGRSFSVAAPALADGWHQLAFSYDGESLSIIVDGRATASQKIGAVRLASDESPLLLGTYMPGYKYCLAGVLSEVCLSDAGVPPERLADEVKQARTLQRGDTQVKAFAPTRGGLVLARDGQPGATIVICEGASALQSVPARELQAVLRKITGARVPLRTDADQIEGNLILVGGSRFTDRMGLPGKPLTGDSFVIKTAPGRLVLLGNDQVMAGDEGRAFVPGLCKWGTSNAVYAFLQDVCGVRWFMPGKLGEIVPEKRTLEVPALDVREAPFRTYALGSVWAQNSQAWSRRNLLGSSIFIRHLGGHLWYSLIPAQQYFAEHPDWFALHDGKRDDKGNHLCTTNKEMLAQALTNLRALYDEGYEWVELGQTDGYQRCQCPACEGMDEYRDPYGYWVPERPADRIHLFHAALADGVRQSHPGRKVLIIAYGPTGEVPRKLDRFPDNVVVEFTHDAPELLARWNRFQGGSQTIRRFTAYVYWFGTYHPQGWGPKSSPSYVASELRRMKAGGAEAFYFCGAGESWGTEAPSYYVAARLLRKPGLDEKAAMGEFCAGLFGRKAAPAMEEFFRTFLSAADRYHKLGTVAPEAGVPYRGNSLAPAGAYLQSFDEATLDACRRLLGQAEAAAPDDAARTRVQFFRDGFEYVRLTTLAFQRAKDWQDRKDDASRSELGKAVQQRETFVKELFARQAANGADLPPVFSGSLEQVLNGPRGEYEAAFAPK